MNLDCRGLSCPEPVIRTKKALEESNPESLNVLVSSESSRENVRKFAESRGYRAEIEKIEDYYSLIIFKTESSSAHNESESGSSVKNVVLFISSQLFGSGDDDLGKTLMTAFINNLEQIKPLPSKIIFVNSGVFLSSEGSDVIQSLSDLENLGVEILSCGTCLQHFNLKEKLKVGQVSNMYTITESLFNADNVVKL